MRELSPCRPEDLLAILAIINESAMEYKGVIPADRWHEPYMTRDELEREMGRGVQFHGCRIADELVGVMGIQDVKDVTLIRHAYVRTAARNQGIGRSLLDCLRQLTSRPILIGTWRAAAWAVAFYEKNGFELLGDEEKNRLLQTYWTIPDRQRDESVVLADERWRGRTARH